MLGLVAGCIVLTWMACGILLIGIGSLTLRAFSQAFSALDALWVGLITSATFLAIWNLFWPISSSADYWLVCSGILGVYWQRRQLLGEAREILSRKILLAVYAAICAAIAFRAAGPCEYYDTGLYGAQMVRWAQAYPAVFGLANVHGRLGFNSLVFSIDAALGHGPWSNFYFHLFGGFSFCVLWSALLPACSRVIRGEDIEASDWFRAIVAVALSIWSARGFVVGTTTDEPSAVLCLAAAAMIFEALQQKQFVIDASSAMDSSHRLLKLAIAATLLVLAVTFKLSVIVFAFLSWILAFTILYSARKQSRLPWVAGGAGISVLAPWLAGRVILSGYPFFPNSSFAFSGDWRVPRAIADMYEAWVQIWGRTELTGAEGVGWLRPWLHAAIRHRAGFQVPMGIALIGFAALIVVRTPARSIQMRGIWLLLPSISGILFWFWKSPDPRFGQPAIWTLAATVGSLAIEQARAGLKLLRPRFIVSALAVAIIWCLFSFGWRRAYQVLEPVDGFSGLPSPEIAARHTSSGLTVYVPVKGNQCWESALVCTPYFDESLEMRSPSNMRWGFRSEGLLELPDAALLKNRGNSPNGTCTYFSCASTATPNVALWKMDRIRGPLKNGSFNWVKTK